MRGLGGIFGVWQRHATITAMVAAGRLKAAIHEAVDGWNVGVKLQAESFVFWEWQRASDAEEEARAEEERIRHAEDLRVGTVRAMWGNLVSHCKKKLLYDEREEMSTYQVLKEAVDETKVAFKLKDDEASKLVRRAKCSDIRNC